MIRREDRTFLPFALAIAFAMGSGACALGADAPELPEGWSEALSLPVEQSICSEGTIAEAMPALVVGTSDYAGVFWYDDALLRCGQQACGFRLEEGPVTRVLIQPCNMRPRTVPRCDCLYEIGFELPFRADRETVELYRRRDFYGGEEPMAPALVDSESLAGIGTAAAR